MRLCIDLRKAHPCRRKTVAKLRLAVEVANEVLVNKFPLLRGSLAGIGIS